MNEAVHLLELIARVALESGTRGAWFLQTSSHGSPPFACSLLTPRWRWALALRRTPLSRATHTNQAQRAPTASSRATLAGRPDGRRNRTHAQRSGHIHLIFTTHRRRSRRHLRPGVWSPEDSLSPSVEKPLVEKRPTRARHRATDGMRHTVRSGRGSFARSRARARELLCSYISPLTHASARTSRATPIVSHAGEDVGVRRSTARAGAPRCQGRRRARPAGRARPGSASRQSGAAAPRVVLLRGGRRAPQRRCACGEAVVRGGAAPCGAQPERGRSAQGHSPDGCGRLAGRRKRAAKLCGPRVRRRRRSQPRRRQPHTLLPTRHAPPPRPRPCACRRRTMGAELALLEARRMETAEQVSSSC